MAGSPCGLPAWGASTLRGALLLKMAISRTIAKDRDRSRCIGIEGSLPSSGTPGGMPARGPRALAKRYFDCQKTKGAGFKPPREAARSFNSREFCFEIWERESAPADYCLIRRLSIDVSCPSLSPKTLIADKLRPRPNAQTTGHMPARGCHFVECSLYVQLVIIERFSSSCAIHSYAQPVLYKAGPLILSSTFCKAKCGDLAH
jgi:hypothetical protein